MPCEPEELAGLLGLDENPVPARLELWRADRIARDADGNIVERKMIAEGPARKAAPLPAPPEAPEPEERDSGAGAPISDYAAALAAAERGED